MMAMIRSSSLLWLVLFGTILWDYSFCYSFHPATTHRVRSLKGWGTSSSRTVANSHSPRVQKLKDATLQKNILKDITSCEFALRVEASHANKEQIIDFDRLSAKLDHDLALLRRCSNGGDTALVSRILKIKEDLDLASRDLPLKHTSFIEIGTSSEQTSPPDSSTEQSKFSIQDLKESLRIRIREDGSVDWDGAVASGKEIAKFGVELWERLNGKEEGIPTFAELFGQAQEKAPQSPEIDRLGTLLGEAENTVLRLVQEREGMKASFRKSRREGIEITKAELLALKTLDRRVEQANLARKVISLNLDMEKICTCLQREVEAASDLTEYRALIAEVTLLDKQLCGLVGGELNGSLETASNSAEIGAADGPLGSTISSSFIGFGAADDRRSESAWELVDEDELKLVGNAVQDLKSRLGLDGAQMLRKMDWGSLGEAVRGALAKVRAGLAFFKDGTALLGSDMQYSWMLIRKAAQGYTLKPREVNALRRTGRDVLTLVPFTIILLIPMTPIGHVLVFSFIQRYFPEFFPSCYSEKRLNLKRLFSEVERRPDDADFLPGAEDLPVPPQRSIADGLSPSGGGGAGEPLRGGAFGAVSSPAGEMEGGLEGTLQRLWDRWRRGASFR